ncbi:putative exported protein [Halobacteriovorax marinus SJ]|uniref:Exported protein n=1 Tax=Halobacteriovorax marinus (strain ATCC BAA-682 / DSM 15412 / SJ) TaxID=862908 RepID=E1X099_HALMS|nr:hypothetical protein [Halobacteriovorax marinus]CBW26327.1 putative exported protein [Halobacteriovorax marinus SJ]
MIKKLFILFTVASIAVGALFIIRIQNKPTTIYPFPYIVDGAQYKSADLKEIRSSDILIVGDRMGEYLEKYIPAVNETLSKNLRNKLNIYNWSAANEGLHRTIKKLRVLKKLPPIVIYVGGSEEFFENRVITADKDVYDYNMKIFKDDRFSSLLMTVPQVSKIIYKKPTKYFYLDHTIKPFAKASGAKVSQTRAELIYNYYMIELEELASLAREKGSTFIYITPPVNLEIPPRIVCDNAVSSTILDEQSDIKKLIESGRSKEASARSKKLLSKSIGNAQTYYLMARAQLNQGILKEAKKNFQMAATFDCGNWRSNAVFNKLIQNNAKKNGIKLIDFANIVESGLGRNITFVDEHYPQTIYYEKLQKEIILAIKTILKI